MDWEAPEKSWAPSWELPAMNVRTHSSGLSPGGLSYLIQCQLVQTMGGGQGALHNPFTCPTEVTLEWRDTLRGYQFPRQVLQTSPQILCLVTSTPLPAEESQPHSSPLQTDDSPWALRNVFVSLFTQGPGSSVGSWDVKGHFSGFHANYHILEAPMMSKMCYKKRVRRSDKQVQVLHASTLLRPNALPALLSPHPLSTKPHPTFLTIRSYGDRHRRILFSFEGNLDNSTNSMRKVTQREGWTIFFQSALMRQLLSWIGT